MGPARNTLASGMVLRGEHVVLVRVKLTSYL